MKENCKYANCKYANGEQCDKHGTLLCKRRSCLDYISKYALTDCKHYRADETKAAKRCSVLCAVNGDAPCASPRIKSNGQRVMCTFFEVL